jgi:peptide deformylase
MNDLPTGGTVRPMTRWGDPVLHAPCAPVTTYDDALHTLVADLVATQYAADGVGLAANQIGVPLSVFVFDCPDEDGVVHRGVVCNPTLAVPEGKDRVLDDAEEGCLSLPGAYVRCARVHLATVNGFDQDGRPVSFSGTGLFARCLQHESDHLQGTVFGDRLPTRMRKKLFKEAEKHAAEFPPDWPTVPSVPPGPAVSAAPESVSQAVSTTKLGRR